MPGRAKILTVNFMPDRSLTITWQMFKDRNFCNPNEPLAGRTTGDTRDFLKPVFDGKI